jgi:hypothetical protein
MLDNLLKDKWFPTLIGVLSISLIASLSSLSRHRMIPGGPFLYLSTDIIPIIGALSILSIMLFNNKYDIKIRIINGCLVILLSTIWAASFREAIVFYFLPYSRGNLFGI